MRKDRDFEDDGRTVADMSDVDSQSVLSGLLTFRRPPGSRRELTADSSHPGEDGESGMHKQDPQQQYISPEERRMWIFGSIRAALLIGLVYIGVLGGVIALMVLLWNR